MNLGLGLDSFDKYTGVGVIEMIHYQTRYCMHDGVQRGTVTAVIDVLYTPQNIVYRLNHCPLLEPSLIIEVHQLVLHVLAALAGPLVRSPDAGPVGRTSRRVC